MPPPTLFWLAVNQGRFTANSKTDNQGCIFVLLISNSVCLRCARKSMAHFFWLSAT
jgi:hypothetical protein